MKNAFYSFREHTYEMVEVAARSKDIRCFNRGAGVGEGVRFLSFGMNDYEGECTSPETNKSGPDLMEYIADYRLPDDVSSSFGCATVCSQSSTAD